MRDVCRGQSAKRFATSFASWPNRKMTPLRKIPMNQNHKNLGKTTVLPPTVGSLAILTRIRPQITNRVRALSQAGAHESRHSRRTAWVQHHQRAPRPRGLGRVQLRHSHHHTAPGTIWDPVHGDTGTRAGTRRTPARPVNTGHRAGSRPVRALAPHPALQLHAGRASTGHHAGGSARTRATTIHAVLVCGQSAGVLS